MEKKQYHMLAFDLGASNGRAILGTFDGEKIEYDFNPRLNVMSHGTGDVYASSFAGAILRGKSLIQSAALAADVVCASIRETEAGHWYGVSFERAIPELIRLLND